MKILFLDIDGVLNNCTLSAPFKRYDGTIAQPTKGTPDYELQTGMNPNKIELLNEIMDKADGWNIVISSSWHYYTDKECRTQRILRHFGFRHIDKILGATDKTIRGRGWQILGWFYGKEIEDFITIDDEPCDINGDMDSVTDELRLIFKDRVYQPYCDIGLTREMADEIIRRCTQ